MLGNLISELTAKANEVELKPGEIKPVIQLYAEGGQAMIMSQTVSANNAPMRLLWGPYNVNEFLTSDALAKADLSQLMPKELPENEK